MCARCILEQTKRVRMGIIEAGNKATVNHICQPLQLIFIVLIALSFRTLCVQVEVK